MQTNQRDNTTELYSEQYLKRDRK